VSVALKEFWAATVAFSTRSTIQAATNLWIIASSLKLAARWQDILPACRRDAIFFGIEKAKSPKVVASACHSSRRICVLYVQIGAK
jgi:hypothetical protein